MSFPERDQVIDFSSAIRESVAETQFALVFGAFLATLTVLAFLRRLRPTLVVATSIPLSLVATFGAMWLFGFTMNTMTLLALALAVGVVIDDAIVVLENTFRFIEEKGMPPIAAAIEGTREIGLAVLATTLSLVIVSLPVSFLSSVTGRILYQLGMTSVVAIMISM